MACYKFKINDEVFEVSSPNIGGETPLQNFARALATLQTQDSNEYNKFVEELNKLTSDPDVKKPDSTSNNDIPFLMQRNLKAYGIVMHVKSEEEWIKFCEEQNENLEVKINPSAKSFLYNGEIYTRAKGFATEQPIHELMHLLLAVLRSQKFGVYQYFINTIYLHPEVQRIAQRLEQINAYSNSTELNFKEEAVVQYLEGLFTGDSQFENEFYINGKIIDVLQLADETFKVPVEQLFGIKQNNFPGIANLFKSLIKDIPDWDSNMFEIKQLTTTGYKAIKQSVIEAQGVKALIDYYLDKKLIKKGPC